MAKINTWNLDGMGYDWREKCPLNGPERYLREAYQKFPKCGDWREPGVYAAYAASRSPLHVWYEEGWEFLRSLEDHLFASSSVHSSSEQPPWSNFKCEWPQCPEPSTSLVNQRPTDRKDKRGEVIWEWLPDAPRFYCPAHYQEFATGEKYVPPTEEKRKLFRAQMQAQHALTSYDVGKVKGTGKHVHFTIMDKNYLQRMVKLIEFFLEQPDGVPPVEMITDEAVQ